MADAQFDPDQYLQEKSAAASSASFDPDKYMADKGIRAAAPESTLKQLGQTAVDSLPMVGGVIGGVAGAETGPGAIGTAGLGYAMGKSAKNIINSYLDPDNAPTGVAGNFADVAKGVPEGMAQEAGGQLIGKGLSNFVNLGQEGGALSNFAEKSAVNATGATGKEASKFAPGTGRAILNSGVPMFGRGQSQLAESLGEVKEAAGKKIGDIISDVSPKEAASRVKLAKEKSLLEQLIAHDPANAVAQAPEQPSLPGMIDDLQRGTMGPRQIETQGPEQTPEMIKARGNIEAHKLFGQPGDASFGEAGGDAASRVGENTVDALGTASKPKTFDTANLPGVGQGRGQTEMILEPSSNDSTYLRGLKDRLATINDHLDSSPGSKKQLVAGIQKQIDALSPNSSMAKTVRNLEAIKSEIQDGPDHLSLEQLEQAKRGYQSQSNYADKDATLANKIAAGVHKQASEDIVAQAGTPEQVAEFQKQKQLFGQMSPVVKAAERRAATTAQHPAGGFLDVASSVAGEASGGPVGAVVVPVARRVIAPRIASTVASTADAAARGLRAIARPAAVIADNPATSREAAATVNNAVTDFSSRFMPPAPAAAQAMPKPADRELDKSSSASAQVPLKGEAKWAQSGLDKLAQHGASGLDRAKLMADPKTKDLLIQASDLKPGSKAMDAIVAKIKARTGSN